MGGGGTWIVRGDGVPTPRDPSTVRRPASSSAFGGFGGVTQEKGFGAASLGSFGAAAPAPAPTAFGGFKFDAPAASAPPAPFGGFKSGGDGFGAASTFLSSKKQTPEPMAETPMGKGPAPPPGGGGASSKLAKCNKAFLAWIERQAAEKPAARRPGGRRRSFKRPALVGLRTIAHATSSAWIFHVKVGIETRAREDADISDRGRRRRAPD